ncbi:hypothetical protein SUGI_1013220 [Cryptomeria japonica]|nr:hypothetical protein SUGI_1013220 [Cryptomeria japonica]
MSESSSLDKPTEIRVTTCHKFDDYLKCIELMYRERVFFSNIEHCLAILSVASELMADDCINKCMQYLEAVWWSVEQESQIRDVLSSLGLKLIPDLAARFDKENGDHIISVERIINEMVSFSKDKHATGRNRGISEQYIGGIIVRDNRRDFVGECGYVLLNEFKSAIGSHKFLTMRSLFEYIKHCDGNILKLAFTAFCEVPQFSKYVEESYKYLRFGEDVFYIIIWFMKIIADGRVIISRPSRITFLTTWLPIMAELCSERLHKLEELDNAALGVVESVPLIDRRRICMLWTEVYRKLNIDVTTPFNLFQQLQDTHIKAVIYHALFDVR